MVSFLNSHTSKVPVTFVFPFRRFRDDCPRLTLTPVTLDSVLSFSKQSVPQTLDEKTEFF